MHAGDSLDHLSGGHLTIHDEPREIGLVLEQPEQPIGVRHGLQGIRAADVQPQFAPLNAAGGAVKCRDADGSTWSAARDRLGTVRLEGDYARHGP